jgi:MoaA/NifB/PqqE/SkfB family radical SAM enzyme
MARVYSSTKPFYFADRLASLRDGAPAAPVHVRIKPTNVCNHDCYFCAYRRDGLSLGADMNVRDRIPREKMREVVDDLIAMDVKAVTFSGGGEPLIYPYISETVTGLAAGDIKVGALTNGAQLKGKVADAFAAHATWIRVSIDGWDGESYARYRNVAATEFDKVMGNLRDFSRRDSDCLLGASIIVDDTNFGEIHGLAARLKACGVRTVKISPCIVHEDGAANNAYHAPLAGTVREQIARVNDELAGPDFEVVDHYHDLDECFDRSYSSCPMAHLLTVIGADCRVYTCQDKAYTDTGLLGSIGERSFRELWNSEDCRQALARLDPRRSCRHHCVADAKNRLLLDHLEADPAHTAFV